MRLYKAVILVNLALALGLWVGYLWWQAEVERLRRDPLDAGRLASPARPEPGRSWTLKGIVRGVLEDHVVVITHEPLPGAMGAMTMGFRVSDPSLTRSVAPGDRVEFTVVATDKELIVVALGKDEKP